VQTTSSAARFAFSRFEPHRQSSYCKQISSAATSLLLVWKISSLLDVIEFAGRTCSLSQSFWKNKFCISYRLMSALPVLISHYFEGQVQFLHGDQLRARFAFSSFKNLSSKLAIIIRGEPGFAFSRICNETPWIAILKSVLKLIASVAWSMSLLN